MRGHVCWTRSSEQPGPGPGSVQRAGLQRSSRGGQAVLFVNANWPFSYNVKREGSVRFAVENSDMTMLDAPTPTANSRATC